MAGVCLVRDSHFEQRLENKDMPLWVIYPKPDCKCVINKHTVCVPVRDQTGECERLWVYCIAVWI